MPIRKGDNVRQLNRHAPSAPMRQPNAAPVDSPLAPSAEPTTGRSASTDASVPPQTIEETIEASAIRIEFQPIVCLESATITAYEALLRPLPGSPFNSPKQMFDAAQEIGAVSRLDALARLAALREAKTWSEHALLFVNCTPAVITAADFLDRVQQEIDAVGIDRHRIILEITEWADGIEDLDVRSLSLREHGLRIAVDDVGAGINGLNQIMSIRPDWIKLDRQLITDLDYDLLKQNLIRFLVHFARMSNIGLIAEGVERREVLETLIQLGVTYAQGYYLGHPGAADRSLCAEVRQCILAARDRVAARQIEGTRGLRLRTLARPAALCAWPPSLPAAGAELSRNPGARGVVYMEDAGQVVGWMPRDEVEQQRRTSDIEIDHERIRGRFLTMSGALSIGEALHALASRLGQSTHDVIVVLARGRPVGIVELRDLLDVAGEMHEQSVTHLSPLTGLPDRVHADRWLAQGIRLGDPCDVALIDLCDFDAYNLAHSYEMGDLMIQRLAGLLRQLVSDCCGGAAFCAHLGGDRFLMASSLDLCDSLHELGDAFESVIGEFFSPIELACRSFNAPSSRKNDAESAMPAPLTRPRVVYLTQALLTHDSPREVYATAERLRRNAGRQKWAESVSSLEAGSIQFIAIEPSTAPAKAAA